MFETLKDFWNKLRRTPEPVVTEVVYVEKTFVLKLDGISGFVLKTEEDGLRITLSGWNTSHWKWGEGDYLILTTQSGRTTRYRITKMKRFTDPFDLYFADCTFSPRGES